MIHKKITFFGLLIIGVGIVVTVFLVKTGILFEIFAAPGQDPKNINITNISDSGFTISYTTDDKVLGTINYGTDPGKLETIVLDDRDQLGQSAKEYNVHSISLKNLNPETVYYFSITSGTKIYLNNNSPYNVKTGKEISQEPSIHPPLSGRAVIPNGTPVSEGLVYLSINGSQVLSGIIKNNGNYTIPLNTLRNIDLDSYYSIKPKEIINVQIQTQNLISYASVNEDDISPIPLITLSNNYDFSTSLEPIPTSSTNQGGFPNIKDGTSKKMVARTTITNNPTPTPSINTSLSVSLIPSTSPTINQPTQLPSPTPAAVTIIPSISLSPTMAPTGNSSVIIPLTAAALGLGGMIFFFLLSYGKKEI